MNFEDIIKTSSFILTEGSMVERLRRDNTVKLDPHIVHAGLIYSPEGRTSLENIYRQYIDIARQYKLPIIIYAPTWRANPERISMSGFSSHLHTLNRDAARFLMEIRDSYGAFRSSIFAGGLLACKGDAYKPEEGLSTEEARRFHSDQISQLAGSGLEFIKAATLPAFPEALGIAQAASEFELPYILSFVLRPDGSLLDGSPLHKAIRRIDAETKRPPLFYMVNCIHPDILKKALKANKENTDELMKRLRGFQANTSARSPEELDNLDFLDTMEANQFAGKMNELWKEFGFNVLGGCCGTEGSHIRELAQLVHHKEINDPETSAFADM